MQGHQANRRPATTADTPHWIVLLYVLVFGFLRSTQFIGINRETDADL